VPDTPITIGIHLFPGVEELDFAGPWEVLAFWAKEFPDDWSCLDLLGSLGNGIQLRPDDRFVDDGNVVTAAGVSAGIDMALHLVARLQSPDRARQVRRRIQYDPEPPVERGRRRG
jgi:putative intracellular protease/amidase